MTNNNYTARDILCQEYDIKRHRFRLFGADQGFGVVLDLRSGPPAFEDI